MTRSLRDAVVVITGATSGIGRATAKAFVAEGAHVAVAARDRAALDALSSEMTSQAHRSLAVQTDVSDFGSVERLRDAAIAEFGRIDVWVNNAGVGVFGAFDAAPMDTWRKVIETNFFGQVHGSRCALSAFKQQGYGTLINLSSIVVYVPQPFNSAYVTSKHAIRALGQCLRQELLLQNFRDIHVVTVLAATVDTPIFKHQGNYTGAHIGVIPPVYSPELAAMVIVRATRHPRREVYVGNAARFLRLADVLFPNLSERIAAKLSSGVQFIEGDVPETNGNVFAPISGEAHERGGWDGVDDPTGKRIAAGIALLAPPLAAFIWKKRHQ